MFLILLARLKLSKKIPSKDPNNPNNPNEDMFQFFSCDFRREYLQIIITAKFIPKKINT